MPIVAVNSDPSTLTLTVVGEYDVPVERLWEAWSDPRQIERFWGPPQYPATFTRHDLAVGGRSEYFMTGPDGDQHGGYWTYLAVEPGRSFTVRDGFVAADGRDDDQMPATVMTMSFESRDGGGSRFTSMTRFPTLAAMEQLAAMGMVEGTTSALGQMDDVLHELGTYAASAGSTLQVLDDTRLRVSRVIGGTVDQVWRAHNDAALLQRWLLGPDGWSMPVCEIATRVGDRYRYEWESADGSMRFGFEGELLACEPPRRAVTSERPIGSGAAGTTNDLTLRPVSGGTLLTLVITCPDRDVRDQILATGMETGMEASYSRLESVLGE